jgi:biotin carboxyl carrier protein
METYVITSELGNKIELNTESDKSFNLLQRQGDFLKFKFENKIYQAEIISYSKDGKELEVIINNQTLKLNLKDSLDQLIDQMGMNDVSDSDGGDVISPMPGLILKILVEEGQEVEKGQEMLVLEAMKMENLLKAPSSGTVTSIKFPPSTSVNKGDLLIKID